MFNFCHKYFEFRSLVYNEDLYKYFFMVDKYSFVDSSMNDLLEMIPATIYKDSCHAIYLLKGFNCDDAVYLNYF